MARGFTVVAEAFMDKKVRGQQALIFGAMSETEPRTIAQIAEAIKGELKTRQDPERVVGFYMTTWKKAGMVKTHDVDAPATAGDEIEDQERAMQAPHDDEEVGGINQRDAESTGATEEERAHAAHEADLMAHAIHVESGMKMSEAVLTVLHSTGQANIDNIVTNLQGFQYPARPEQVRGALSNLMRRGVVREVGSGIYEAAGPQ